MSPPERLMRRTIEWLLALPEEERRLMEQAELHAFTRKDPAPGRTPQAGGQGPAGEGPLAATLNCGAVEAAAALCRQGCRPALLNFAHGYNCGGGFEHSGGSQEEDIFRKSSLFLSLWPHRREDDGPGVLTRGMWIGDFDAALPRKEPFYPHRECGGIYSPHVRLTRSLHLPGGPMLPPEDACGAPCFAVLTVAAQDVSREGYFDPALLREKVRTTLFMAAAHGHDVVVLGAFGCGYFKNPPATVAETFAELLNGEFAGAFVAAVFAVPDRRGMNLDAFSKRFPVMTEQELAAALPAVQARAAEFGVAPAGGCPCILC